MGLGAGELVLILVIAYVVVGPEDMAKLARTLAKTIRQFKKMSADLSREVGSGLQLPPVSDLTGEVRVPSASDLTGEIRIPSVREIISDTKKTGAENSTVKNDAAGSASADLDSVLKEIEKVEADQRDRVHDAGVVGVKGDDIGDTVVGELTECHRAVKGLAGGASVLAALIQEGQDDGNTVSLAADSRNDALDILKIVVRRHAVFVAADFQGLGIIGHVADDEEVGAADRIVEADAALSGAEPGVVGADEISGFQIARAHLEVFIFPGKISSAPYKILVDSVGNLLAPF